MKDTGGFTWARETVTGKELKGIFARWQWPPHHAPEHLHDAGDRPAPDRNRYDPSQKFQPVRLDRL